VAISLWPFTKHASTYGQYNCSAAEAKNGFKYNLVLKGWNDIEVRQYFWCFAME